MGQLTLQDNIPILTRDSDTQISLPSTYQGKAVRITVGGQQYTRSTSATLSTGSSGFGGLDTGSIAANTLYYVYAVVSSGVLGLTISTANPGTGPTGFSAWKEIGRFRTRSGGTQIALVVNRLVGPSIPPQNSVVGDWQTLSFTLANLGLKGITNHATKARVTNTALEVEMRIQLNATAAGAGGSNFTVNFPTGYTIDSTKVAEAGGRVGAYTSYGVVGADTYDEEAAMFFETTTALRFVKPGTGVYLTTSDLNIARIMAFNLYFTVPILELSGLFTD
jgi:hypothetical protein